MTNYYREIMNKNPKQFYLFLIAFVLLIALAIFLNPVMKLTVGFFKNSPPITEGTGTLRGIFRSNRIGIFPCHDFMLIDLNLMYPKEMQENQTSTITLNYNLVIAQTNPTPSTESWTVLPHSVGVSLNSSAFDIAPSEFIIKKTLPKLLPMKFVWTITPKREGEHILLLDASLLMTSWQLLAIQNRMEPTPLITFTLNEQTSSMQEVGVIELHVKVKTIWGVSKITVELAQAAIGLLAFILLYPIFVDWIKVRPKKNKVES